MKALVSIVLATWLVFCAAVSTAASPEQRHNGLTAFQALPINLARSIQVPEGTAGKSIVFKKIALDILHDENVGEYRSGLLCLWPAPILLGELDSRQDWVSEDAYGAIFRSVLARNGYHLKNTTDDLFEDDDPTDSDYQVAGRIVKIFFEHCQFRDQKGKTRIMYVRASMSVEWQLYDNRTKRVVHSIVGHGSYSARLRRGERMKAVLQQSFRSTVQSLLADKTFYRTIYGDEIARRAEVLNPIGLVGVSFDTVEPRTTKEVVGSIVKIETSYGKGDGIVLSSEGYILTSAANIGLVRSADLKTSTGKKLSAMVVRSDPLADVALLRIVDAGSKLQPLSLRREEGRPEEEVWVVRAKRSRGSSQRRGRLRGKIVEVQHSPPDRSILISDIDLKSVRDGSPILDNNGNVLGIKIRDFSGEESKEKSVRFITINSALNSLLIYAMQEAGDPG